MRRSPSSSLIRGSLPAAAALAAVVLAGAASGCETATARAGAPLVAALPSPAGLRWDENAGENSLRALSLTEASFGEETVSFLWWNIRQGQLRRSFVAGSGVSPLDKNLRTLAASPDRPDVIALGEYRREALEPSTREALFRAYPHHRFFGYNARTPRHGILVASRHPMGEPVLRELDFTPPGLDPAGRNAYRQEWESRTEHGHAFARTYINLPIHAGDRVIHFVPVHLIQPWQLMMRSEGWVDTAYQVMFGIENPLMYQLLRLRVFLQEDEGRDLDRNPLVVMGDFNVPDGAWMLGWQNSVGYQLMQSGLRVTDSEHTPTFPARSAPERQSMDPMRIDHAFVSRSVEAVEQQTLELQGSDHYALWVSVTP